MVKYDTKNSILVALTGAFIGGLLGKKLFMDPLRQEPKQKAQQAPYINPITGMPSWDPKKRAPVRYMIDAMKRHLEGLRKNPLGVDRLSETGIAMIIKHLEHYEKEIDNGPPEPNPIWGILAEYTPWITSFEKQYFGGMAYYVTGLAEKKQKELAQDQIDFLKKLGAL